MKESLSQSRATSRHDLPAALIPAPRRARADVAMEFCCHRLLGSRPNRYQTATGTYSWMGMMRNARCANATAEPAEKHTLALGAGLGYAKSIASISKMARARGGYHARDRRGESALPIGDCLKARKQEIHVPK